MAAAVHTLVCGCVATQHEQTGHRPSCWMGEAETIAAEAIIANSQRNKPGNPIVAALQALAEAGYLSAGDDDDQVLFGLLDFLADTGLLDAPAGGAR